MDLLSLPGKRSISARDEPNTSQENKKLKIDADVEETICQNREGSTAKSFNASENPVQELRESPFSWPNVFVSPARPLGTKVLCSRCKHALRHAFRVESGTTALNNQSDLGQPSTEVTARKIQLLELTTRSRKQRLKFFSFEQLQSAAKICSMCSLTWLVLSKNKGVIIKQANKYSDARFNPLSLYYEDGITDVDELLGEQRRVWFSLSLSIIRPSASSPTSNLLLEFDTSYKTGVQSKSKGHRLPTSHLEENLLVFTGSENEHSVKLGIPVDSRLPLVEKVALMKEWLSRDASCDISPSLAFLPTRLLYVHGDGYLRLVHTMVEHIAQENTGEQRVLEYVALSHRWGVSQHFTSTKATIDKMSHGFSINELPLTFKDAVQVATWLGFSYLWIDALCILQDDEEDWKRESKRMGDVFGNARFSIAVHCAAQDSEGFLPKSMAKRPAVEFKYSTDITFRICRRADLEADVTNSQLCKRGWVLQERFLASRTIHFTEGQIYFETTPKIQSEDGHLDLQTSNTSSIHLAGIHRPRFFSPSAAPHLRELFGLDPNSKSRSTNNRVNGKFVGSPLEWLDLVEMYSNCDLTNESDKLMAIAGMAQKIHLRTEIAYCAGIWGDRISQGLLWLRESIPLSSPACRRAPSWSWAAFDGPIQFPDDIRMDDFTPACELLAVNGLDTRSDTGQLDWLNGPGSLDLRTEVIHLNSVHVAWNITELGPGPPRTGLLTDESPYLPRITLKSFVPVRGISWASEQGPFGGIAFDEEGNCFDPEAIASTAKLPGFCFAHIGFRGPKPSKSLREQEGRRYLGGEREGCRYLGVFLVATKRNKNEYRRVGFGQLSSHFGVLQRSRRVITIV